MKRTIFFTGILSFLWISNTAQKAATHSDINSNTTNVNNTIHPQLAYPEDKTTIVATNPVFIWLPPPGSGGTLITYSLRIVKVLNGQTPQEALFQNPGLVNLVGLTNNFLSYPVDAPPLENTCQYAWQVAASSAGKSLGTADIHIFFFEQPNSINDKSDKNASKNLTMANDPLKPDNSESSNSNNNGPQQKSESQTANVAQTPNKKQSGDFDLYPVASKVSDGHFYLTNGIIRLAYINKANDKKLTYAIKRLDNNKTLSSLPQLNISPGTNKLAINLQHIEGMEQDKYYDLEITDSKGQVYSLIYYYINQ